jgi:hypothetical protein
MTPPPEPTTVTELEPTPVATPSAVPPRLSLFSEPPIPRSRILTPIPPQFSAQAQSYRPDPLPSSEHDEAEVESEGDLQDEEPLTAQTSGEDSGNSEDTEGDASRTTDEDEDLAVVPRAPITRSVAFRTAVTLVLATGLTMLLVGGARRWRASSAAHSGRDVVAAADLGSPSRAEGPSLAADEPTSPVVDEAKAADIRRRARRLLESGQASPGVALAREAIMANPDHPESYVLLAAGLQDLGRWRESQEVFVRCVRDANGKPKADCIYFAGRGR